MRYRRPKVKGKEEDDWRGQEELYWAQESTTEDESLSELLVG